MCACANDWPVKALQGAMKCVVIDHLQALQLPMQILNTGFWKVLNELVFCEGIWISMNVCRHSGSLSFSTYAHWTPKYAFTRHNIHPKKCLKVERNVMAEAFST